MEADATDDQPTTNARNQPEEAYEEEMLDYDPQDETLLEEELAAYEEEAAAQAKSNADKKEREREVPLAGDSEVGASGHQNKDDSREQEAKQSVRDGYHSQASPGRQDSGNRNGAPQQDDPDSHRSRDDRPGDRHDENARPIDDGNRAGSQERDRRSALPDTYREYDSASRPRPATDEQVPGRDGRGSSQDRRDPYQNERAQLRERDSERDRDRAQDWGRDRDRDRDRAQDWGRDRNRDRDRARDWERERNCYRSEADRDGGHCYDRDKEQERDRPRGDWDRERDRDRPRGPMGDYRSRSDPPGAPQPKPPASSPPPAGAVVEAVAEPPRVRAPYGPPNMRREDALPLHKRLPQTRSPRAASAPQHDRDADKDMPREPELERDASQWPSGGSQQYAREPGAGERRGWDTDRDRKRGREEGLPPRRDWPPPPGDSGRRPAGQELDPAGAPGPGPGSVMGPMRLAARDGSSGRPYDRPPDSGSRPYDRLPDSSARPYDRLGSTATRQGDRPYDNGPRQYDRTGDTAVRTYDSRPGDNGARQYDRRGGDGSRADYSRPVGSRSAYDRPASSIRPSEYTRAGPNPMYGRDDRGGPVQPPPPPLRSGRDGSPSSWRPRTDRDWDARGPRSSAGADEYRSQRLPCRDEPSAGAGREREQGRGVERWGPPQEAAAIPRGGSSPDWRRAGQPTSPSSRGAAAAAIGSLSSPSRDPVGTARGGSYDRGAAVEYAAAAAAAAAGYRRKSSDGGGVSAEGAGGAGSRDGSGGGAAPGSDAAGAPTAAPRARAPLFVGGLRPPEGGGRLPGAARFQQQQRPGTAPLSPSSRQQPVESGDARGVPGKDAGDDGRRRSDGAVQGDDRREGDAGRDDRRRISEGGGGGNDAMDVSDSPVQRRRGGPSGTERGEDSGRQRRSASPTSSSPSSSSGRRGRSTSPLRKRSVSSSSGPSNGSPRRLSASPRGERGEGVAAEDRVAGGRGSRWERSPQRRREEEADREGLQDGAGRADMADAAAERDADMAEAGDGGRGRLDGDRRRSDGGGGSDRTDGRGQRVSPSRSPQRRSGDGPADQGHGDHPSRAAGPGEGVSCQEMDRQQWRQQQEQRERGSGAPPPRRTGAPIDVQDPAWILPGKGRERDDGAGGEGSGRRDVYDDGRRPLPPVSAEDRRGGNGGGGSYSDRRPPPPPPQASGPGDRRDGYDDRRRPGAPPPPRSGRRDEYDDRRPPPRREAYDDRRLPPPRRDEYDDRRLPPPRRAEYDDRRPPPPAAGGRRDDPRDGWQSRPQQQQPARKDEYDDRRPVPPPRRDEYDDRRPVPPPRRDEYDDRRPVPPPRRDEYDDRRQPLPPPRRDERDDYRSPAGGPNRGGRDDYPDRRPAPPNDGTRRGETYDDRRQAPPYDRRAPEGPSREREYGDRGGWEREWERDRATDRGRPAEPAGGYRRDGQPAGRPGPRRDGSPPPPSKRARLSPQRGGGAIMRPYPPSLPNQYQQQPLQAPGGLSSAEYVRSMMAAPPGSGPAPGDNGGGGSNRQPPLPPPSAPSYHNPGTGPAAGAGGFGPGTAPVAPGGPSGSPALTVEQKRKLLWTSKNVEAVVQQDAESLYGTNRWDRAAEVLESDREKEKFQRLMGLKGDLTHLPPSQPGPEPRPPSPGTEAHLAMNRGQQDRVLQDMEQQYLAGLRRKDTRTAGLGV